MQRQASILSFLRKPSSEVQRSGGPAPSCDASRSQIPATKDPGGGSSAPVPLPVDPDPEVRGTDTPPVKPLRGLFRARFPTSDSGSEEGLAAQPFASIMRKFVKEEKNLEAGNRGHHESFVSPSKSGCPDINNGHKENKSFLQEQQNTTVSVFTDYSDVYDLEVDVDVPRPETPAMRPLVPRLKRVQEDYSECDNKYGSLLGSGKRLKSVLQSNKEKKTHEEAYESSSSKFDWLNPANIKDEKGRPTDDPLYDKRTLFIPPDALKKMSASQRQYWSVKCKYMDVVLFFKVGKFYELYELDAEIGQKELDWKMTISGVGKCRQVGISESGIDDAVQKLTERGYKVGRMEQMETSDQAKARGTTSVIQRKLINVSTPSTVVDGSIGQEAVHLLALREGNSGSENSPTVYGFAFLDHAALKFWVGSIEDNDSCAALGTLLMQISPREIIYEQSGLSTKTHMALKKYTSAGSIKTQMSSATPNEVFLDASNVRKLILSKGYFKGTHNSWSSAFDYSTNHDLVICALGGLIHHLTRLMLEDAVLNGELLSYHVYKSCLRMDGQTLINLEIFNNNCDAGLSGTLYKYLDHCITASGKRLLRRWICHPLKGIVDINDRLDIVEGLVNNSEVISIINGHLRRVPDLERLLGRVRSGLGSSSTLLLPFIGERILKQRIKTFGTLVKGLRTGIDLLNALEREDHGVLSTSKYVSIPKLSGLDELLRQFEVAVNDDFPQYQNHNVQDSDAQTLAVLAELFAGKSTEWSRVINALNCIDVLQSFAVAAISSSRSMSRPVLVTADSNFANSSQENAGPILRMRGLWHPYATVDNENDLVPNDINFGEDATGRDPYAMLLTGPNMGGKSTIMRASCLAVILAQLGCYVPCETCILSPVDTIFTRLGATDRIMSGESTFYVECSETASVLRNATRDSLVLLDELGRGTSTFDGYAIAYAVFRHLVEMIRCRLLFATHYHPLTKEFESHPHVTLQHMACAFQPRNGNCFNKELIFLYKLTAGACPESYGLQVALLAGIPESVVETASRASQKMKINICKRFKSSEGRSQFSTLHEEWLKTLLSVSRLTNSSWNEDACDTLLCVWHELKSLQKSG